MAYFCGNCGAKLKENDKFCSNCGQSINSIQYEINDKIKNEDIRDKYSDDNTLAILGFIFALFHLSIIGLILCIIALSKAKDKKKDRKGFAIAGIVIICIRWAFYILLTLLMFFGYSYSALSLI